MWNPCQSRLIKAGRMQNNHLNAELSVMHPIFFADKGDIIQMLQFFYLINPMHTNKNENIVLP